MNFCSQTCALLFLLLGLQSLLFGQQMLEKAVIPDIYKETYFRDYNDYSNIASVTIVTSSNHDGFIYDTIRVKHYNALGQKEKVLRFDDNEWTSTIHYQYDEQGRECESLRLDEIGEHLLTKTYDEQGRILQIDGRKIRSNHYGTDTTYRVTKYLYEQGNLVELQRIEGGKSSSETYTYSNGMLYEKHGRWQSHRFAWDDKGRLQTQKIYSGKELKPGYEVNINSFYYDDRDRIILDTIIGTAYQKPVKPAISRYTYDESDRLREMNIVYGESFRDVVFEYENEWLKSLKARTNTGNSAYLRLFFLQPLGMESNAEMDYREEFEYDEKGNRVSRKVWINSKLHQNTQYIIVYRD